MVDARHLNIDICLYRGNIKLLLALVSFLGLYSGLRPIFSYIFLALSFGGVVYNF